uniref:YcgL domain-containing protein n=1 Tax=Ningiella ruwaisensis TaxID=2364274 RepID=UPI00109F4451|nr:YcgL domain-containing protein [Ningiella ruwaisensis]
MLCAVYKSKKKADTYLYVKEKDDFSDVPESLLSVFGQPQFVMLVPANKRPRIAGIERERFLESMNEQGYYLQMPPKPENLLQSYRASLGLSNKNTNNESNG